jgi:hypothetical protein
MLEACVASLDRHGLFFSLLARAVVVSHADQSVDYLKHFQCPTPISKESLLKKNLERSETEPTRDGPCAQRFRHRGTVWHANLDNQYVIPTFFHHIAHRLCVASTDKRVWLKYRILILLIIFVVFITSLVSPLSTTFGLLSNSFGATAGIRSRLRRPEPSLENTCITSNSNHQLIESGCVIRCLFVSPTYYWLNDGPNPESDPWFQELRSDLFALTVCPPMQELRHPF